MGEELSGRGLEVKWKEVALKGRKITYRKYVWEGGKALYVVSMEIEGIPT